jgi:hypothetical protein
LHKISFHRKEEKVKKVLMGDLDDLFSYASDEENRSLAQEALIGEILSGREKERPGFKIPAADRPGSYVLFENEHALRRFTALVVGEQKAFLDIIRVAMDKEKVNQIFLNVTAAKGATAVVVTIERIGPESEDTLSISFPS